MPKEYAPGVLHTWTGGDTPADHGGARTAMRDPVYRRLVGNFLRGQVQVWRAFWGDMPDSDTLYIFVGRARLDAWRTRYPTGKPQEVAHA